MPRCYMVKKSQRHDGPPPRSPTEASVAPPYYSPTDHRAVTEPRAAEYAEPRPIDYTKPDDLQERSEYESRAEVAETPASPGDAGAGGGTYAELRPPPYGERSAAETEAAHELLSLAQSVPPLPPAVTAVTVLHDPAPLVPLYTYTIQPTNIFIIAEEPPEPIYTTMQAMAPLQAVTPLQAVAPLQALAPVHAVEYLEPHINYVTYQPPPPPPAPPHPSYAEHGYTIQGYTESPDGDELVEKVVDRREVVRDSPPRSRYDCSECGKRYATSSNLSRHKQTHRSLDSVAAKRCEECGKAYVSMPALAMHVLTHRKGHVCGVCGKQFSRPWLLRGHLRSHTGEKPYCCGACGKAFADRSNLRAHLQTHSADKKHECARCRKSFALKSYLNKHQEAACARDDDD